MKSVDKYLEEAIKNIHADREVTRTLLKDIMRFLSDDDHHHEKVGPVAAKYVETLQRSNEQLVKIAALLQKKETTSAELSQSDKEEIFELIQNKEAK